MAGVEPAMTVRQRGARHRLDHPTASTRLVRRWGNALGPAAAAGWGLVTYLFAHLTIVDPTVGTGRTGTLFLAAGIFGWRWADHTRPRLALNPRALVVRGAWWTRAIPWRAVRDVVSVSPRLLIRVDDEVTGRRTLVVRTNDAPLLEGDPPVSEAIRQIAVAHRGACTFPTSAYGYPSATAVSALGWTLCAVLAANVAWLT